uniref:Uncharacterized protein n=1 Tax=Glossina palpalis gambiensis TaxID=67801 RepID=A0A1B0BF61_9MUSC
MSSILCRFAAFQRSSAKPETDYRLKVIEHSSIDENDFRGKCNNDQQHSQLNELLSTSFVDDIRRLLKRGVTQPILSLDKSSSPYVAMLFDTYNLCSEKFSYDTMYVFFLRGKGAKI